MIPEEQKQKDTYYMELALKQAERAFEAEEVPVGVVVVHQEKVIAKAHNQCEQLKDPTAHAEMIAITMAAEALQRGRLNGTTIYSTIEPCFMCAGALLHARIDRLVFGALDAKFGACGSIGNIVEDARLNHQIPVTSGVLEVESKTLMQEFFRLRRQSGQNNDDVSGAAGNGKTQ